MLTLFLSSSQTCKPDKNMHAHGHCMRQSCCNKCGGVCCMDLGDYGGRHAVAGHAREALTEAGEQEQQHRRRGSGSGSIEYVSLRDVLVEGGGCGGEQRSSGGGGGGGGGGGSWREYSCHDIHDFDASNIGIRNQLLKHAASAYLQSAVVVPPRDQGCLARLWRHVQLRARGAGGGGCGGGRGRGRVLMRACTWQGCVDDPAELYAAFVARSARRIAAFLAGIWA